MRTIRITGLFLGLVAATAVRADSLLYTANVTQANAEVRCAPGTSQQVYVTNHLPFNTQVKVLRELPDRWLEIVPPDGSYSWISMKRIRQISPTQRTYVVEVDQNVTEP